jgi:hypothetical protein
MEKSEGRDVAGTGNGGNNIPFFSILGGLMEEKY